MTPGEFIALLGVNYYQFQQLQPGSVTYSALLLFLSLIGHILLYLYICRLFLDYSSVDMTKSLKPKSQGDGAEGPDGGWGWVLVVAMFVSSSLVFGLMRSLGVFFVEFVQYFEESAQAISWISSIGLAAQQFFSRCNVKPYTLIIE